MTSTYSKDTMAAFQRKRQLAIMNPHTRPIAAGNFWGNQVEKNNEAFMLADQQGQDTAPMIDKARQLAMPNFLENTTGMNLSQRQGLFNSPMPMADTGEGRMGPSAPDPFSGGYQPRGKGDPYGKLPRRPKGFAMGGTMGMIPSLADSIRMTGNKISAINQGLAPDNALLMGKQYWQGLDQELAQQRSQGFAMGGTLDGPGGPTDDMIPAVVDGVEPVRLSDGEEIVDAKTRDFFGKKFFLDLKKKAMKGEMEGMQMQKPKEGNVPGFAEGATMSRNMGGVIRDIGSGIGGFGRRLSQMAKEVPLTANRALLPIYGAGGQAYNDFKAGLSGAPLPAPYQPQPNSNMSAEGLQDSILNAYGDQAKAQYINQTPVATFDTSVLSGAGIDASRRASGSMGQLDADLGQFFANEQAKTDQGYRDIAETRARQEAMMQYKPGSPAPRVVSTEPLPTGGSAPPIFTDRADPEALLDMRARRFLARQPQPGSPALTPAPVMAQPALPTAEDVRFNGLAARAALDSQKPAFRPAPLTMTEKERAGMTRPSKTPLASPEMEAALTGLSGMAKRQARQQFQADEALFNRADQRGQMVEQRQGAQQAVQQDITRAKDFTDWLQKDEIRNQRDMEAEQRLLANRQAMTKEERAYQEGLAKQDTKEKEERARNFVQIPETKYKVNGLGSVVGMDGKPVSLTPEEATKLGLVVKGADSKGNLTYSAAKPKVEMQRFYDPMNGRIVELAADEMAPEGSGWKPIQKQGAAPAANAAAPTSGNITKEAYAKLKPGDTYIWNGETKTKR